MAYTRQPCDSYFVESQESFPAVSHQDYAKMLGRRRQEAMGDVLSQQAYEAYVEEHVAHMKQIEVSSLDYISVLNADIPRTRPSPMSPPSTSSRRSSGS
jgi:hypothetical protein